jgi:16S rRNA (adenine1518-N6/adenine1519-N6)-dimethyltransferase
VRLVADAGNVAAGDVVVEVGPGTGTLTEELLSRGAEVIAVEIDRDLARLLRERFVGQERFTLIEGDALSSKHAVNEQLVAAIESSAGATASGSAAAPPRGCETASGTASANVNVGASETGSVSTRPRKLVANLPYNIASPLVIESLILGLDLLAFTVQKEVADRLRAAAGSDAYGPLSAMAQLLGKVEVLRTLPPQAFWPAPKIDSALVRVTRADQLGAEAAAFSRFLSKLFSFRRKTLRKALQQSGVEDAEGVVAGVGLDGQRRPEEFSPGELVRLYRAAAGPSR